MCNPLRAPDDQEPWPITPTPGGPIGPLDHVGHVDEHARLWAGIAEGQTGVRLTGDRRQGKTSLLNLVGEELLRSPDHRVLRVAGETTDPATFASRLRAAVRSAAWLGREAERWAVDLDVSAKGFRVRREGGVRDGDRRRPLDDDLVVLAARRAAPRRLVVVVDEVTVLLQGLQRRTEDGGSELLHSLRRARQEADNLAVVLSGSMGLHHVVASMQPLNDLVPVRVGRLTPDEATFLAHCLILGAGIDTPDPDALAGAMAAATDGGAFYLHHVTDRLGRLRRPVAPSDAHDVMRRLLDDPDDPLDFRHYRDRLQPYYGEDAALAGTVLDAVATAVSPPLTTDDVVDAVAAATAQRPARELVVSILERLEQDHYLEPTATGTAFSSELLRRGWIVVRRLAR